MADQNVREIVKQRYGEAAKAVSNGTRTSCCGGPAALPVPGTDPITRDLYSRGEANLVPAEALLASFGCGNPTALAELKPGEVVLDLGSGGGIDVILSARRVGPTGKAYGLDMTDEMLALARENARKAGIDNVEFLQGTIESIPLPDASVDVIISNCVINLSTDKDRVLREAFRVLKPGGRLAVSDIVVRRPLPPVVQQSMEAWIGCVAGALQEDDYLAKLRAAGFADATIEPTRVYGRKDAEEFLSTTAGEKALADGVAATSCCGGGAVPPALLKGGPWLEGILAEMDGAVMSGFVRARRP